MVYYTPSPSTHCFPPGSETTQRKSPIGCSKPNLKALVSKKGRSICREQNLVRRSPGRPCRKGALKKRLGSRCPGEWGGGWSNGTKNSKAGQQGYERRQRSWAKDREGGRFMHRLLGAVHEAAVQLSKLPIGDVPAALFKVLHGTEQNCQLGPLEGVNGLPHLARR